MHESYVGKLRSGWRPTRVRKDLWDRLVAASVAATPGGRSTETAALGHRGESRDYYRGQQDVLRDLIGWAIERQASIGPYLKAPADPPSPTVDEVEEEAAVMSRLPQPETPPQAKRRRA